MIPRKPEKPAFRSPRVDPALTLVGDVRPAPFTVDNDGKPIRPDIAIFLRATDGTLVVGAVAEPGRPARTLYDALFQTRGSEQKPIQPMTLPGRVLVFEPGLARELRLLVASYPITVDVTVRLPIFDDVFARMAATIGEDQGDPEPFDLPDDVLKPLLAAIGRYWRARPWEYAPANDAMSVMPRTPGARPLFAALMGEDPAMAGLNLFTSLDDYDDIVLLGETLDPGTSDDFLDETSGPSLQDIMEVIKHESFLIGFEPKDRIAPVLRDQILRCGWSKRLKVLPFFTSISSGTLPRQLTSDEAAEIAVAVDALVTFCERKRTKLSDEETNLIEDTVEILSQGQPVLVTLAWPADEDLVGAPITGYRFKVSLTGYPDVWRRIELTSRHTLEDLHNAIQTAFGWDNDHLYAFFLSGKDWDLATEYMDPWNREPGDRGADVRLDRLRLHTRQRIRYIFDFGDTWRHDIRVEKINLKPDAGDYPRFTEQAGTPPAQYGDAEEDDDVDGQDAGALAEADDQK